VFLDEFTGLLEDSVVSPSEIIISGDFNIHVDEDDESAHSFSAILEAFGFQQHVGFPTHNQGHTLDLLNTLAIVTWLQIFNRHVCHFLITL